MNYVQRWIEENSKQYTFDNRTGLITTLGKFQGEPLATVYYWNAWLDGDGETGELDGYTVTVFDVTPEESEAFYLSGRVAVWQDENGFVYSAWTTRFINRICFD